MRFYLRLLELYLWLSYCLSLLCFLYFDHFQSLLLIHLNLNLNQKHYLSCFMLISMCLILVPLLFLFSMSMSSWCQFLGYWVQNTSHSLPYSNLKTIPLLLPPSLVSHYFLHLLCSQPFDSLIHFLPSMTHSYFHSHPQSLCFLYQRLFAVGLFVQFDILLGLLQFCHLLHLSWLIKFVYRLMLSVNNWSQIFVS